ncbi:START domain-containing protein [Leptospira sp. GIMC2001]|uniref:START domain-containing protein n=1 Tax=Leptospira sp. GIMC2001 TaxID=1513297 RepID=UPI00234A024C|nr:START domain-containing protein [Leptospira sp. GIMC2001]WCL49359.1 START domain-containing protein [Leptospira sp. GIMC2001]
MNLSFIKTEMIFFLLLAFGASSVYSQSTEWKEAKKKNGITVLTREYSGSSIDEFMGKTEVEASLSQVVSLLSDPAACEYLYFNCKELVVLSNANNRAVFYLRNGAPWPVANRDVVVERLLNQNPKTKVITMKLKKTESVSKPSPSGVVRIEEFDAVWRLTPLSSGKVRVEYQAHFEPGGSVPQSVINLVITDTPYNTLANIKKVVGEGKFREAKIDWIAELE